MVVVPGRGETRATYGRFAARLAYDAYQVVVADPPAVDPASSAGYVGELTRLLADVVAAVVGEFPGGVARPLVLIGSDVAAAGIAAAVARTDPSAVWWPEAVVLAALPGYDLRADGGWDEELSIRTNCPVHRGVLGTDEAVRRGTLADAVPDKLLDPAYQSTASIPHLLLIGDADPLADRDALAGVAKTLPTARLSVVRGARHDVLNDLQHRSVAAEVVMFLEALRTDLVPAIAVAASGW